MARIAKKSKPGKEDKGKTGLMMLSLLRSAFNTAELMSKLSNSPDALFASVSLATAEYLVEESESLGAEAEKFQETFIMALKKAVKEIQDENAKDESEIAMN